MKRVRLLKVVQAIFDSRKRQLLASDIDYINQTSVGLGLNVEGFWDGEQKKPTQVRVGRNSNESKQDSLSHFVCVLAFAQSSEQRQWLLKQECRLFRYRLEFYSGDDVLRYLQESNKLKIERLHSNHADW